MFSSRRDDPGVLCFQHCLSTVKVFCLDLPERCPSCNATLSSARSMRNPPVQLPYPFVTPKEAPCSILIRPTDGDFLHFYKNSADLHIGITNSKGDVFEFDRNGMHAGLNNQAWGQSLRIPIVNDCNKNWKDYWDHTLDIAAHMDCWTSEHYIKEGNNCYSFVMTFLKMLQVTQLRPSLCSKTQFCKDFIVPRTRNAAKYIALYRQVIKDGVAVISVRTSGLY